MVANQLNFLHLHSVRARQNITYNCFNSNSYGIKLLGYSGDEFYANHELRKQTYNVRLDNCQQKNNQWGKTVFEIDTRQTKMLPVKDIALQDVGEENQKFGLEIGEVCFS
uniref:Fibrillar collagen NC1 domain-containing protein n=2 Tax=Octopus bimaculoides TaxID=37653 RepID=A0A0L8HVP8_OCTBM